MRFIIDGISQDGTTGADSFEVLNGTNLAIDASTGLDSLRVNFSGSLIVSYDSLRLTRTLGGNSTVTGTFTSFESTEILGGSGDDTLNLSNSQGALPVFASGGPGNDSLSLPYTHYTTEYTGLTQVERNGQVAFKVSSYDGPDLTFANFESIGLGEGGSQLRNLSLGAQIPT